MTPENLNGVGVVVCIAELLVFSKPVHVGYCGVGLVEVDKQIQRSGSAILSVRSVFKPYNFF